MELAKIVIGIIHTINDKEGTAQCILPEYDGRKTSYLQFLFPLTKNDKEYKIPEIDSPVVCLFIGEDDRGFILGTFYTEVNQTPETASRRSEEHTSELQSRQYLVCRLLLEKKKTS